MQEKPHNLGPRENLMTDSKGFATYARIEYAFPRGYNYAVQFCSIQRMCGY